MRCLLIAEKPDLARKVQAAYKNRGFKDMIDFKAFHGHIMSLYSPEDYDEKLKKWSLDTIPIIPDDFHYKPSDEATYIDIKKAIDSGKYDYLINCCDPEREGQHIFHSFYETIGCKLPVKRMWHADLTEDELIRALNNMEDDVKTPRLRHLTEASKIRADIDWLIGMNASRIVSIKRNSVTRIGRVVIPTLEILAKREKEIADFKPETTYSPLLTFVDKNNESFKAECQQLAFKDVTECDDLCKNLKGKIGIVKSFKEIPFTTNPDQFFSTADLQAEANKEYGYTLQETLSIMQALYDRQILSYPRVECNHITKGVAEGIPQIIDMLKGFSQFKEYVDMIDTSRIEGIKKDKRYVDDSKVTSHYAITFTGQWFDFDMLSKQEKDIITLVAKNLIAALCRPCKGYNREVTVTVDDNDYTAKGKKTTDPGFKLVYGSENNDKYIPEEKEGDKVKIVEYENAEHTTKAPSRYNDASIIKAMIDAGKFVEDKELAKVLKGVGDSGGIGRPSTRAAIVEKLVEPIKSKNGSYCLVKRNGKAFYVTEEGMELATSLEKYSFSSPALTALWEQKLLNVEDGKTSKEDLYAEVVQYTKDMCKELMSDDFKKMESSGSKEAKYVENAVCPICGKKIKETDKYYICEGYSKEGGCSFVVGKEINSAKITPKEIIAIANNEHTKVLSMKSKNTGNKYSATLYFDKEEKKVKLELASSDKATSYKCPVCGKKLIAKKGQYGPYYVCEGGDFTLNGTIAQHKLSAKDIKELTTKKETSLIEDFVSKSGKQFSAQLVLNASNKAEFKYPDRK